MNISTNINITKKNADGRIVVEANGSTIVISTSDTNYSAWDRVYSNLRLAYDRETLFNDYIAKGVISLDNSAPTSESAKPVELSDDEKVIRGLENLIKFFSEFEFEPNFRFTNTLAFKVAESKKSAKEYIENYFALVDNSYKNEVATKLKSREFGSILDDIALGGKPTTTVNKRFKVYYGSAGTGKTTLAQTETDKRCIVCNASMLPSDLMEDFVFVEGKPSFKPSKLWDCMTNGKAIVLDEINLLPFDSLRFLQGILDGKTEFDYKGHKVEIADGFQIIGTMNLTIGGMTYGLPEPLIDRCADMRKFVLSADMLKSALS